MDKEHIRLSHVQIDIISGICAGIVSNIVSHPLDTVKVRMQIGSTETVKIIPTIKTIYQREGVRQQIPNSLFRLEVSLKVFFSQSWLVLPSLQCNIKFL